MSKAWKRLESEVARVLRGVRNIRVSYSEKTCDVIHPTLAIECKYGKQVPGYLAVDKPVCYEIEGAYFVVGPTSQLNREGLDELEIKRRAEAKFLINGLEQAANYKENEGKFPVLCLKTPRMRGFNVGFRI